MVPEHVYLHSLREHLEVVARERCVLADCCELIATTVVGVSCDIEAVEGSGRVEKEWELLSAIRCVPGGPTLCDINIMQQEAAVRTAKDLSMGVSILWADGAVE